jgi:hypothetical protein
MKYLLAGWVALILFGCLGYLYLPFTSDDAFIALRYARNLSLGLGPCFNPGEMSYGFTSPLWIFLLSLFPKLGLSLLGASKAFSFLSGATSVILFLILAKRNLKRFPWLSLGLLAWAMDPWLVRWAPSGMESSLAAALVLLSLLLFESGKDRWEKSLLAGLSLGLAFLARPECALLFLSGAVVLGVNREWRPLGGLLLGFLMVALPWVLYAEAVFHRVLPNTFSAKAELPAWQDSLRSLVRTVRIMGPSYLLEIIGLVLTGFYLTGKKELLSALRRNLLVIIWLLGLPVLYVFAGVTVQSRYLLVVIPLVILLGIKGWERVLSNLKGHAKPLAWGIVSVLMLATNLGITFGWNYPTTMKFSQGVARCLVPLGGYLRENTPVGSRVALVDIGAVGYYSERGVVDLGGLIQPDLLPLIVKHPREKILPYLPGAGYGKPEFFITRTPDPGPEDFPGLTPLLTREFGPLGVSDPHTVWTYKLYKVNWDSLRAGP